MITMALFSNNKGVSENVGGAGVLQSMDCVIVDVLGTVKCTVCACGEPSLTCCVITCYVGVQIIVFIVCFWHWCMDATIRSNSIIYGAAFIYTTALLRFPR